MPKSPFGLEFRAAFVEIMVDHFPKVQSHREACIQAAKYRKLAKEYDEKYTPGILTLAAKNSKAAKQQGEARHRVLKQGKIVDKHLAKIIEENMVSSMNQFPGKKPVSAKKLRGEVQKKVEGLNAAIHKVLKESMKRSLEGAREVLGGTSGGFHGLKAPKD